MISIHPIFVVVVWYINTLLATNCVSHSKSPFKPGVALSEESGSLL